MEPIIGRLYVPTGEKGDSGCGAFDGEKEAKYIRFENNADYDILDKNEVVLDDCACCLHPNKNNVKLVGKTLEDIEEGDLLVDGDGDKRLVLGRAGRMVWLANTFIEIGESNYDAYSINEIKDLNFTLYSAPAPTEEPEKTIEIEGKKFTVQELKDLIENNK